MVGMCAQPIMSRKVSTDTMASLEPGCSHGQTMLYSCRNVIMYLCLLYVRSSFSLSAIALPIGMWHGLPFSMCRVVSRWLSDSRLAILPSGIALRLPLPYSLPCLVSLTLLRRQHAALLPACCLLF